MEEKMEASDGQKAQRAGHTHCVAVEEELHSFQFDQFPNAAVAHWKVAQ